MKNEVRLVLTLMLCHHHPLRQSLLPLLLRVGRGPRSIGHAHMVHLHGEGPLSVRIVNAGRALPPGANINAAIRSREAAEAVIIPKESLRREGGGQGVSVLAGTQAQWRAVKLGVTNITHAQVLEGVAAGDRVLLATDVPIRAGQMVTGVSEAAGR